MKTKLLALTASLGVIATLAFADGHAPSPEDQAVSARKAQMSLFSFKMGKLGAMAKGEAEYDGALAAALAGDLKDLASLEMSAVWVPGSDNTVNEATRALPAIWEKFPEFEGNMKKLADAAAAMEAAAGTDLAGLQGSIGAAGEVCGTCHKAFRGPAR